MILYQNEFPKTFCKWCSEKKAESLERRKSSKASKDHCFFSDKDCSSSAETSVNCETSQTFNNTSSTAVNTESNSIVSDTSFTADTDSIVADTSFTADIQPCSISTDTSSFASTSTTFNTDSESHSIAVKTNVRNTATVAPPSNDPALWDITDSTLVDYWVRCGPESCRNRDGSYSKSSKIINEINRKLNDSAFVKTLPSGETKPRHWLLYSPSTGRVSVLSVV